MPARSAAPSTSSPRPTGGLLASIRWIGALVLPLLPFAIETYAGAGILVEAQRLVLLALVAIAAALFGIGPGILAALVATAAAAYDAAPPGHWVIGGPHDTVLLVVLGACALAVAFAAGTAQQARAATRTLQQHAALAERTAGEHRQTAEQLGVEVASLRTAVGRRDADLAEARSEVARAERARRALLDSLPPEHRAPHTTVPTPLQLFPPIFTPPPLGVPMFAAQAFPGELPETLPDELDEPLPPEPAPLPPDDAR